MGTRLFSIKSEKFMSVLRATFLVVISLILRVPMAEAKFFEAGVQKFETPVEAAHFTLKELGGKEISLRELRAKVVVINFFTVD